MLGFNPLSSAPLSDTGAALAPPASSAVAAVMILAAPVMAARVVYRNNVERPTGVFSGDPWGEAAPVGVKEDSAWTPAAHRRAEKDELWGLAVPVADAVSEPLRDLPHLRPNVNEPYAAGVRADSAPYRAVYEYAVSRKAGAKALWEVGRPVLDNRGGRFKVLTPLKSKRTTPWGIGARVGKRTLGDFQKAAPKPTHTRVPWERARMPFYTAPVTVVTPPEPPPYVFSTALNFACPCPVPLFNAVSLNFSLHPCPPATEVPVRKVYFIVNSVSMTRVSDGRPLTLKSASVGTDHNSRMWSLTAALPRAELQYVEPGEDGPVEVELTINGLVWRFLVEEYDDSRQFATGNVTVKGRSVTALLDAPYSPTRSFAQTEFISAYAFAQAELVRAGLDTDYSLDWNLIDSLGWDMPANTWSYTDLSPMQVIQTLVAGAGGFVNSHPSNKIIQVRAEYPLPYWQWAEGAADLTLPKSVVRSQTLRWTEKPTYNGVYVSGETTGVTALVKRTGTAGNIQAPTYVSPMISASAAARQKGLSILSAGGKQAEVNLEMPLLASFGLMTPGLLVEITNGGADTEAAWRGLVRGVALSAAFTDGLTVSQSVTLERHYGGL